MFLILAVSAFCLTLGCLGAVEKNMTSYLLGIAGYAAAVFVVANVLEKILTHRKAHSLDNSHPITVPRYPDKQISVGSD